MLCSGAFCVHNYGILPASIASYYRSVEQTQGQSQYLKIINSTEGRNDYRLSTSSEQPSPMVHSSWF